MENYKLGEIVLIAFPFSDAKELKRRPALVLLDVGDEDIMVARVTSQAVKTSFDLEIKDWQGAGLLLPSIVRIHKVATLGKNMVERKLGKLREEDWRQVREMIRKLWMSI